MRIFILHDEDKRAADFSFGQPPCFVQGQTKMPKGVVKQGVQIGPTQVAFAMVVAARMQAMATVEMMSLRIFVLHD
jgi:hypothetical protein